MKNPKDDGHLSRARMAYFCPVDWRWIKQRPQFLAEELDRYYDIHVIYPFSIRRRGLQKECRMTVKRSAYYALPSMNGRNPWVNGINAAWTRRQIESLLRRIRPDYIWLSMPWQIDLLPPEPRYSIIYDCMDDYPAIDIGHRRQVLLEQERRIIERAGTVFSSSVDLREKLCARYAMRIGDIHLLRNGFSDTWQACPATQGGRTGVFRIGYFGTIGRWFDSELLVKSIGELGEIEYHLYGPLEKGMSLPAHERIYYHGVAEHDRIPELARPLDALIMPFQVNDIVKSVDPVKLYEYIFLGKNIICAEYPEIQRFEEFVYFYRDERSFLRRLESLARDNTLKYGYDQARAFLRSNSWKTRAREAADQIGNDQRQRME